MNMGFFKNNRFGRDDRFNLQFRAEFFNIASACGLELVVQLLGRRLLA